MNDREYQRIAAKGRTFARSHISYVIDSLFETMKVYFSQDTQSPPLPATKIFAAARTDDSLFLIDAAKHTDDLAALVESYVEWKAANILDNDYGDPPRELVAAHYRIKNVDIDLEDEHEW